MVLSQKDSSFWKGYVVALLVAIGGVLIRWQLNQVVGYDAPLMVSVVAVLLAAWYGGLGPGLCATGVSLVGGLALLLPTLDHRSIGPVETLRLCLFLFMGIALSVLTDALYRTALRWRQAEQEKEFRILQERNLLAREIHDTLAQGLTGVVIQLEVADAVLDEAETKARYHVLRAHTLARKTLAEARRSVQALRPQILEERDLPLALREYSERLAEGTPVRIFFLQEGTPPVHLKRLHDIESDLLRIGLEAVTNAVKHAQGEHIAVTLTFGADTIHLLVRDDGRGFDPACKADPECFGLVAMRERAERIGARFDLTSAPGSGTTVHVVVPLNVPEPRLRTGAYGPMQFIQKHKVGLRNE